MPVAEPHNESATQGTINANNMSQRIVNDPFESEFRQWQAQKNSGRKGSQAHNRSQQSKSEISMISVEQRTDRSRERLRDPEISVVKVSSSRQGPADQFAAMQEPQNMTMTSYAGNTLNQSGFAQARMSPAGRR